MSLASLFAIAVALAMDAFAVAIGAGLTLDRVTGRRTFRLAFHFGLFQALMPILGWAGGLTVRSLIESWDHWVAFGLLVVVGGRMLWEALGDEEDSREVRDPTRGWTLVVLSVATSIDALAVGLSLALLGVSVWLPALVIGLVALVFTAVGLHLGRLVGALPRLARGANALGGLVLMGIGLRILWDHGALRWLLEA
jgi:putative Mn2+ efflux pump MntP